MFQQIHERWLKNHQTLLPGLRFRPFDFKMLLRDVNLAPRPDRWRPAKVGLLRVEGAPNPSQKPVAVPTANRTSFIS